MAPELLVMETSNPLWHLVKILRQSDVSYALRVHLHLQGDKNSFVGNRPISIFILFYFILFLTPCLFFLFLFLLLLFFLNKSFSQFFYFLFFIIILFNFLLFFFYLKIFFMIIFYLHDWQRWTSTLRVPIASIDRFLWKCKKLGLKYISLFLQNTRGCTTNFGSENPETSRSKVFHTNDS